MKKYSINRRKLGILTILIIAILLVGASVFSYAKYITENIWNYYLDSQKFYFTSAHLDGTVTLDNYWNGGAVAFELSNFNESDEVSAHEINYEIKCTILNNPTGNLTCNLNGTNLDEYSGTLQKIEVCRNDTGDSVDTSSLNEETCNNRGYTWVAGNSSLNQYFEIESTDPNTEIDNVKVKIEAKATEPYSKTLTGEFHLSKGEGALDDLIIEHQSFSDYEKIIISNFSYRAREFFLRWNPDKVKITKGDYTNESIDTSGFINEIEFKVEKNEILTFTYYKTNPSDTISVEDFILVEKPEVEAIRVTSIELVESSAGVVDLTPATFTDNQTNIHIELPDASATFSYRVTIENTTPNHYYLKNLEQLSNTLNIKVIPTGMSLYHKFDPGTISTFYIEYNGDSVIQGRELILNLQYIYEEGKLYEDETLNGSTPEIIDGLIPIVYNESTGNWEKADVVNGKWYDYSTIKWANAASVVTSKRNYYVESDPGTVVEMADITSMLVWIPRYSYTRKDDLGYQGYGGSSLDITTPGAFDIKFVGAETTDTGSGTYTGQYPSEYYTSSAFCWGNSCDDPATRNNEENTETKGFWVAKFEASRVNNILYSKPNTKPMTYHTIADTFYYVQNLMNGVNGYDNYGYVGFVDAHLIKNSEWGAISYLSQSKYGKYGNADYTGANKEIYINNCTTYITGIGGSTPHQGSTTATCYTNTYDTYYGMGASTTGNIYGVYDMVGGTFDRVMGIILDQNGNFVPDFSGFTELPEGRYINIYPYGTYTQGDVSPIKGDGLTETLYYYSDRYLGDPRFSSTNYYLYHWVYRGGSLFFSNTDANGIFSYTLFNGQSDAHHSSRFTITMYDSVVNHIP